MRKYKFFAWLMIGLIFTNMCFGAWDPTRPADDELKKDVPGWIRAGWLAIQAGTDPALQITNAKVSATADIVDTKLHEIGTANKVNCTALKNAAGMPSGAGVFPVANVPNIDTLLPSQTGNSGKSLITNGSAGSWGYPSSLTIASAAIGDMLYHNGSAWVRLAAGTSGYVLKAAGAAAPGWSNSIDAGLLGSGTVGTARLGSGTANSSTVLYGDSTWKTPSAGSQAFYYTGSTQTFTAPTGVTSVFVSMVGGGGGGGCGTDGNNGASGGGGGASLFKGRYAVTPGNNYNVVVGAAGVGGTTAGQAGTDGGNSTFDTTLVANGGKGSATRTGGAAISFTLASSGSTAGTQGYLTYAGGTAAAAAANPVGTGGGASYFGSGGNGGGGLGENGANATGYGGGGGGSGGNSGSTVGGNGSAGMVYIEW